MVFDALIGLQILQVAILWLHDWVPMGALNDVARVQAADTRARLIVVTVVQSLPYTVGLALSIAFRRTHHPAWIFTWLWVSYGLLFAGELRAWWWPYLVRCDAIRAARYETMFGATHAFLPPRNGITPNTLHCILHAATAATLLALALVHRHG